MFYRRTLSIGAAVLGLVVSSFGSQDIIEAAKTGDLAKVRALVEASPGQVGAKDQAGRTPLHWACRGVHPEVVEYLVAHGADVNARDNAGVSPLHSVSSRGHVQAVKTLIAAGARIEAKMNDQSTPLHLAAAQGHGNLVALLLEKGAPVDVRDGKEDTTLHAAAWGERWDVVELIAGELKDRRKTVLDLPDFDGNTVLHLAAAAGRMQTVKILAAAGAGLDGRNTLGQSAFNLAEAGGFSEVASWLKEKGVDRGSHKFPKLAGPYLGQVPPGSEPKLFAKGIVSTRAGLYGTITFSPDGREAVWRPESKAGILYANSLSGTWGPPRVFSPTAREAAVSFPFFSLDGRRVYFTAGTVGSSGITEKEIIAFAEKIGEGWSERKAFDSVVNSLNLHWQFSLDETGNVYFSGPGGINCSRFENGRYLPPAPLPEPINEKHSEEDKYSSGEIGPFISPRGDYLIYSRVRAGTPLPFQLFIAFKRDDGSWSEPRNLSEKLRTEGNDSMAMVTPDGKFLFFQSQRIGSGAARGLYWVDARVIEDLRPKKEG